jgi:transposase
VAGDARSWSQQEQERTRRRAVAAVLEQGLSQRQAARLYGVHENTVSKWVRAARSAGSEVLAAGRRGRRPGEQLALSGRQQAVIVRLIRDKNPDQLRLPFALWTREAVRDLIERRYGIRLAIRTVGDYLRRWGFTPQKPIQRAYERDPAAVERWLQREYPALRRRAKREGALILWGDEMGLRSDDARGRSYAPQGKTPVIGKAGRRFGCNVIQAVGNRGELWFRVFAGRFSQDVFIDFLKRLLKTAGGRKLILIVDGHPGHRGRKARTFIETRADLLEVVYLPGYSPDLNPAEYVNNDTKHGVLTQRPANKDKLLGATRRHLHRRQKQPHVVQNFFRHPSVAYAA